MSITERFDQPGFKIYSKIEQLLFKACSGKEHDSELTLCATSMVMILAPVIFNHNSRYYIHCILRRKNRETLHFWLEICSSKSKSVTKGITRHGCRTLQLLIVMPATNCTSERSFSALRRIKSYLRSTMSQARLNHLMVLHYHQDMTDNLDLKTSVNDFIRITAEHFFKILICVKKVEGIYNHHPLTPNPNKPDHSKFCRSASDIIII